MVIVITPFKLHDLKLVDGTLRLFRTRTVFFFLRIFINTLKFAGKKAVLLGLRSTQKRK